MVGLALKLMLRRPGDKDLLSHLQADLGKIVAGIPTEAETHHEEMRQAASRCIQLLQTAKELRRPREHLWARDDGGDTAPHAGSDHTGLGAHGRRQPAWKCGWCWALALAILAGGAIALVPSGKPPALPAHRLVEQMKAAAQGVAPATHVFGGPLHLDSREGRIVVVAEGVPTGECVSAAWELVKVGDLAVNGMGLVRVTGASLSTLCRLNEAGATLAWTAGSGGKAGN